MHLQRLTRSAARAECLRELKSRRGGVPFWTRQEDAILRKLAPDYDAIFRCLPHRTRRAAQARCYWLNLKKGQERWLASEISLLRKIYPTAKREELLSRFPNYKVQRLHDKASQLKLKRPRLWRKVGHPLIDKIRERAVALNMTMHDVDAVAGTKGHFGGQHSRLVRRANQDHIARAVEALGGRLVIEWDD